MPFCEAGQKTLTSSRTLDGLVERFNGKRGIAPTGAVIPAKAETLTRAFAEVKRYQPSFRVALLWATIREASITTLLPENFQHELLLGSVRIINPFRVKDIGELLT